MPELILYSIVLLAAYFGVGFFRRWSSARKVLDIPNERSLHTRPTPRGGGLVIVVCSLLAYVIYNKIFGRDVSYSYLLGACVIAFVSWLDDIYQVSFVWRFIVHAAAAIFVVGALGFFQEIDVPLLGAFNLGAFGRVSTVLWIIWLTNAFNFMDGIDGLAGTQALTAGIGWLSVGKLAGADESAVLGGALAFSSFGFLLHNWSPAKIFMGDVGSAFLGFSFAVLPLLLKNETSDSGSLSRLPVIAVVLVWFFLFDTILTFCRRAFRGERVWEAHRGHVYQKLVTDGYTHRFVCLLYGAAASATTFFLIYTLRQNQPSMGGLVLLTILLTLCILSLSVFSRNRRLNDQSV